MILRLSLSSLEGSETNDTAIKLLNQEWRRYSTVRIDYYGAVSRLDQILGPETEETDFSNSGGPGGCLLGRTEPNNLTNPFHARPSNVAVRCNSPWSP
jgi:hypothetical protein